MFYVGANTGIVRIITALYDVEPPLLFHIAKDFVLFMAERVGFEPTLRLREDRFSRAAPWTTRTPLQAYQILTEIVIQSKGTLFKGLIISQ